MQTTSFALQRLQPAMIRLLRPTLRSAMSCRPHHGLGSAAVLFACEGTYQLSGGQAANKGIFTVIAGWLKPDQFGVRHRSWQLSITSAETSS